MCGIVASVDPSAPVLAAVRASRHRGPDASGVSDRSGVVLGHARLAILDLDGRSDQPMQRGAVTVSYNGELWNHVAIRTALEAQGCTFSTTGDTEVVAAALATWGRAALRRFDGMFALAWTAGDGRLHLARDRFGELPLHYSADGAASELKVLQVLCGRTVEAAWVQPGEIVTLEAGRAPSRETWHGNAAAPPTLDFDAAAAALRSAVCRGVADRTLSDVPVCALLSGGLDSTVIAWAASQVMPGLVAYTAVQDPRSSDLRAARTAAAAIGCELREVQIPEPTAADLAATVAAIELPHKAQVEIGWPCLVLAARIRADGFKVVFSGEGADELFGSYGFAYHGIKRDGFGPYRRRLFLDQHRKNFARCNKAFMTAGVECRLPFLHPPLVDLAWSLPVESVRRDGRPKAVLEAAFADVVPLAIMKRAKVAFQDGLGMKVAAGRAVSNPAAFYRSEYARCYPAADRRRGADEGRRSDATDHGTVRRNAGAAQRLLF